MHYIRRPLSKNEHFATPLESLIYNFVPDKEEVPCSREEIIAWVQRHCQAHPDEGSYSLLEITQTLAVLVHKHFLVRR